MPYYEMSLENGREYIYENNFDVAEAAMGLWLIVFLDVDWLGYQTLAEQLWEEGDTIPPESGDQDYIEQWQIGYARKVAEWYWHLKSELSPQHPLLNLLVEQQFHNHLLVALQPDPMYELSPEMQRKLQSACLEYMELIDKPSESDSQCWVHPDYLREWLRFVAQILHQLHDCQQKLTPLLDRVMYGEDENHDSILSRYYPLQKFDLPFQCLVESSYRFLSPQFHITKRRKMYRYDKNKVRYYEDEKLEGHTYMATDALHALTIWEFEMVCAHEIQLRRCAHCNRYFIPYSVVNCYCDRPVEGKNGKTCKDIGAMSKHQQKVNRDEAKKLYRKVCNRIQTAAKRRMVQYPDILRQYKEAQLRGQELLEQVETGQITYEEFQEQFDKTTEELLGIPK